MPTVYSGEVRNGVVILDDTFPPPPEGTKVRVQEIREEVSEGVAPTLAERLQPVIGMAKGLPPDLAAQHDHYLHGLPKQ